MQVPLQVWPGVVSESVASVPVQGPEELEAYKSVQAAAAYVAEEEHTWRQQVLVLVALDDEVVRRAAASP